MERKPDTKSKIAYPLRINKYLAHTGKTTRRGADELIRAGRIALNGRNAVLGDIVKEGDTVEIKPNRGGARGASAAHSLKSGFDTPKYYVAYHKPRGIKTTSHTAAMALATSEDESDTLDYIEFKSTKLFPMGRLDKNTSGLMIFSNDGRITDRLLNPKYAHEREYEVQVDKPFSPGFLTALSGGVEPVSEIEAMPAHTAFRIVVTDGGQDQIQKMCAGFNLGIVQTKRVRIINIRLKHIPEGEYQEIEAVERDEFLAKLGL